MIKTKIKKYGFSSQGKYNLSLESKGIDWPVVYLIHNDNEIYVGETSSMINRFAQHLNNPERVGLKDVEVIFDDEFNKSAILDIEQSLIHLISVDKYKKLQNKNGGQSEKHNYYQREKYLNKLDVIWNKLNKIGLVKRSIDEIKNDQMFKYSPYNTLTPEQNSVCFEIIYDMMNKLSHNEDGTFIIRGGAGTGKTIVLVNLIYKLVSANKNQIDFSLDDEEFSEANQLIHDIKKFIKEYGRELKIGYIVPMSSIRKTLTTVFSNTGNGLTGQMVIGPFDVFKKDYDVVVVDEAHRLCRYNNISFRGEFKKRALELGMMPEDCTQLDMIVKKSKYRILVYDENQTVKGSDITHEQFIGSLKNSAVKEITLKTQMRCLGGNEYISYLDKIFDCDNCFYQDIVNYDFKLYDDVEDMTKTIGNYNKTIGLSVTTAGYGWKWISEDIKTIEQIIKLHKEDITIGKYKYFWNLTNQEFILKCRDYREIGCIHTTQGYDLNYVGVIFGPEIDYDPVLNKITIDRNNFYDKNVKNGTDDYTLKQYIINSYKVMMTRGIKGCYVYVYNENLREYLKKFIRVK